MLRKTHSIDRKQYVDTVYLNNSREDGNVLRLDSRVENILLSGGSEHKRLRCDGIREVSDMKQIKYVRWKENKRGIVSAIEKRACGSFLCLCQMGQNSLF